MVTADINIPYILCLVADNLKKICIFLQALYFNPNCDLEKSIGNLFDINFNNHH